MKKIEVKEAFFNYVEYPIEVMTPVKQLYKDVYGDEEWRHKYFLNRAFRSQIDEMEAKDER